MSTTIQTKRKARWAVVGRRRHRGCGTIIGTCLFLHQHVQLLQLQQLLDQLQQQQHTTTAHNNNNTAAFSLSSPNVAMSLPTTKT